MAYPRKYKVTAPVWVAGHGPGETFTVEAKPPSEGKGAWLEAPLVEGGLLKLVSEAGRHCPACVESGTKKAAGAEYSPEELADHYEKDHPGLAAPGEEE